MYRIEDLPVLILSGGRGTRLKEIVSGSPKVLAPIEGKPFLHLILNQLQEAGFVNVVLCTGYMADEIETVIGAHFGRIKISYSREEYPLGTGGAIGRASCNVDAPYALVMNGDSFIDIKFSEFLSWHISKDSQLSIVVTSTADSARYGTVNLDSNGKLLGFSEKMQGTNRYKALINAGIYLIGESVLRDIPGDKYCSFERDILPNMINNNVYGYLQRSPFIDIGTPQSYFEAPRFFQNRLN